MSQRLTIESTIRRNRLSRFIYSSLSFYGSRRGGGLPGMWFIRAMDEIGRDAAAVRQTLFRLEREGVLVTRKIGRAKLYAATSYASAEINAGLDLIFAPQHPKWDGQWTLVYIDLRGTRHRVDRERVIGLLEVEGFAHLGGATWAHPNRTGATVRDALTQSARPHVVITRGNLVNADATQTLIARYNLPRLAKRYRTALTRLGELDAHTEHAFTNRDAFLWRFGVVLEFLAVAWTDPRLPARLLPNDWPGEEARSTAARLYKRLLPGAIAFADELYADTMPSISNIRSAA